MTTPTLFTCSKVKLRLTEAGCARMFRSAAEHRPEVYEGRRHCVACPIGAANAGVDLSSVAPLVERLRQICPRCARPSTRLINGERCVSCYNRQREVQVGADGKGNRPGLTDRLQVESVVIAEGGVTRTIDVVALSLTEVLIAQARRAKSPMAFGPPPADLAEAA